MKLVDTLINLLTKGYYINGNPMDFDLEDEGDFYIVGIVGAVQLFRDESKREKILTATLVRDEEKENLSRTQMDYLAQERSVIDMYHHLKNELLNQGFLHLSNEDLAQGIFNRYKIRMPGIRIIRQGGGQWIFLPEGRKAILDMFKKREEDLKNRLKELTDVINEI